VADTTLSLLAEVASNLPTDFPTVRLANLMWLRQPASTDLYMDDVLRHAKAIVIEHLGAPSDWAYIVDQVCESAAARGQWLVMVSGECVEDAQLLLRSTAADMPMRTASASLSLSHSSARHGARNGCWHDSATNSQVNTGSRLSAGTGS